MRGVYAIVDLSAGILLIGFVMLKGIFRKSTAYVGVITGILGIVSIAGWNVTIILNAAFATLSHLVGRLSTLPARAAVILPVLSIEQ